MTECVGMNKQIEAFDEWWEKNNLSSMTPLDVWLAGCKWQKEQLNKPSKSHDNKDCLKIFNYWLCAMRKGPTTKFTQERKRAIANRLKEEYSVEDIKLAIHNCSRSDFHMGQNEQGKMYNDLTLICRNGSKLESFRDMLPKRSTKAKEMSARENLTDRSWALSTQIPGIDD